MKLSIFAVGRLKEKHWKAAEAEYVDRLSHFTAISVREFSDIHALEQKLPGNCQLIMLDRLGKQLSSEDIAVSLDREMTSGGGRPVVFAIGGAEGFTEQLRKRADHLWAFGNVTLPHRIARVVLLEQLYRGFSILRNLPYHK